MKPLSLIVALALLVAAVPALAQQGAAGVQQPQQAPSRPTAPGLSEAALGPPAFLVVGDVSQVEPDKFSLVVSTFQGNQPVDVTSQTTIRNSADKPIKLSGIEPGDRVFVAFYRAQGKNPARIIYRLKD
jgi:translation initiation factor IF-1